MTRLRHTLARLICPEIFAALDTLKARLREKTADVEYLRDVLAERESQLTFRKIVPAPRRVTVGDLPRNTQEVWR